jgi:sugar O-acyltransferase (sialic acid O-acetyltransferase NeuD family)
MNKSEKHLLILGSGDFAIDVADWISEIGGWHVSGFAQNVDSQLNSELEGRPIYWIDEAFQHHPGAWAVCALGSLRRTTIIEQAAAAGAQFATLVHPFTRVSGQAELGEGSIVCPGALISAKTRIGKHVIVNRGASIGHHVEIGDFVFIAPDACICGSCVIGTGAYIGAGAVLRDHIVVGAGALVGAGAVVTKDVPENTRVTGVPARSQVKNPAARS